MPASIYAILYVHKEDILFELPCLSQNPYLATVLWTNMIRNISSTYMEVREHRFSVISDHDYEAYSTIINPHVVTNADKEIL